MNEQFPPLLYVAGAYCGDVSANISKAEEVSIALIRNGWHVFTPHKNTAGYEQYEDGTLSKTTWIEMDLNILSRCNVLFVMNNWKSSIGTQKEIHFASVHDIQTVFEDECPAEEFFPEYDQ